LQPFLTWCDTKKVTVIVAAGNSPEKGLHETVPQRLGSAVNGVITVGGVKPDGTYWEDTTPAEPNQLGSMSVYAPSVDVIVPASATALHTGTSQAAAIVSGLAAYLYSLDNLGFLHAPGVPFPRDDMKNFIIAHAWTRVPLNQLGSTIVTSLNVVYNLARGDPAHEQTPCAIGFGKRDDKLASACSWIKTSMSTVASSIPLR
jgi:subtilisin family serine protease